MGIVRKGRKKDPFKGYQLTCGRCGTVFALEGEHNIGRHHIEADICYARCPQCRRLVTFRDLFPHR